MVTINQAASKKCVHDTICAEIKLSYPVLTGGLNPVATQAINDSLLSFVYMVIGGNPKFPLATGVRFCVFKFVHDAARSIGHVAGLSGRFYQWTEQQSIVYQNVKLISSKWAIIPLPDAGYGSYGLALIPFCWPMAKPYNWQISSKTVRNFGHCWSKHIRGQRM